MSRTIDTHTHVLADEAIKRLQKEIPSLGLKLTPLDTDNSIIEVAGVPYRPSPKADTTSRGGSPTWTQLWSTCRW
ncbi:MAG: hypothetical protein WBL55_27490 [Xanthobacteraceae bacterium]